MYRLETNWNFAKIINDNHFLALPRFAIASSASGGIAGAGASSTGNGGDCRPIRSKLETAAEEIIKNHFVNPNEDVFSRPLLSIDDVTKAAPSGCVPQVSCFFGIFPIF